MKTKEELDALKKEYEELSAKLRELSDEELKQIAAGKGCPNLECPEHLAKPNKYICYDHISHPVYNCCWGIVTPVPPTFDKRLLTMICRVTGETIFSGEWK